MSPLGLTSLNRKNLPIVVTLGGIGSCYTNLMYKTQAFYPNYKLRDNTNQKSERKDLRRGICPGGSSERKYPSRGICPRGSSERNEPFKSKCDSDMDRGYFIAYCVIESISTSAFLESTLDLSYHFLSAMFLQTP
jgi:hypothetical protein